ncbi:MAG TPA: type II toxin-antitoxin system RelE/ParE family toxin [Gemmataceae bacterium]|nr:type II toxin-antitoxin system RelE/ParE family toxin [Gemmataceae bacterium]
MAPHFVGFHPLAARDLQVAYAWYARRNPAAAQRFRHEVRQAMQRIASAPDQGSPFRGRFRWTRLGRFSYVVYYEVLDPVQVIIYAVAHASRRPGYWLRRASP